MPSSRHPSTWQVSGMGVRPILERSGLPVDTLRQVWNLSDIDRDGQLDSDEFAVAMHLTRECGGTAKVTPDPIGHGQRCPGSRLGAHAASRCSPGPPACSGLPSSLGCRGDYGGVLVPAPTSPAPLPFERCPLWPRRCTTGKAVLTLTPTLTPTPTRCTTGKAMPATLPPDLIPPSKRR